MVQCVCMTNLYTLAQVLSIDFGRAYSWHTRAVFADKIFRSGELPILAIDAIGGASGPISTTTVLKPMLDLHGFVSSARPSA